MNTKLARYFVQRRRTGRSPWCPVAHCDSLEYARILAATGVRRHLGVAYRVIQSDTGASIDVGAGAVGPVADLPA